MKLGLLSTFLSFLLLFISGFSSCDTKIPDTDNDNDNSSVVTELHSDDYEYNIPSRYYSSGIKNIVKRSRQIYEMTWMPIQDLQGFNGDYIFYKGQEVKGIPYSQPVNSGKFLIYETSLKEFLSESKIKNGIFYTQKGKYEEDSTYYGMDCSAFVSYAWNMKNRLTAKNLSQFGDIQKKSINSLQVGDAVIRTAYNSHAVLVTGIKEDSNNNVIWIEITEQTPPLTKRTRYGENELFSLKEFLSFYLNDGYEIYRDTDHRHDIPYEHNCSSPVDDVCKNCYKYNEHKKLTLVDNSLDDFIFEAEFATINKNDNFVFSYAVSSINQGIEKYNTDKEHYIKLRDLPRGSTYKLIVPPGTFITIFDKIIDDDGNLWGRSRYNNKVGWLDLTTSEYLGGEIFKGEETIIPQSNISTISVGNYSSAYKCNFSISENTLSAGKKITVFVKDSLGNKYIIGEFKNSF